MQIHSKHVASQMFVFKAATGNAFMIFLDPLLYASGYLETPKMLKCAPSINAMTSGSWKTRYWNREGRETQVHVGRSESQMVTLVL